MSSVIHLKVDNKDTFLLHPKLCLPAPSAKGAAAAAPYLLGNLCFFNRVASFLLRTGLGYQLLSTYEGVANQIPPSPPLPLSGRDHRCNQNKAYELQ